MFAASAQDETGEFVFSEEHDLFLVGTAIDVMFHEAGHMVIDVYDIPMLGQEEDAADNFATLALLSMEDDYANAALMQGIAGWYLMGAYLSEEELQFFGEHDLSIQRASRKVCHLISSEPEDYGSLAQDLEMDEYTVEGCSYRFAQTLEDWVRVLEEKNAFGESPDLITITYQEANPGWEEYRRVLEENEVLEFVAQYIGSELALPRAIELTAQHCDEPNAFYSPDESRLTFCYEFAYMLHNYYVTSEQEEAAEAEAGQAAAEE